MAKVISLH